MWSAESPSGVTPSRSKDDAGEHTVPGRSMSTTTSIGTSAAPPFRRFVSSRQLPWHAASSSSGCMLGAFAMAVMLPVCCVCVAPNQIDDSWTLVSGGQNAKVDSSNPSVR